jgi:hypothetical protein
MLPQTQDLDTMNRYMTVMGSDLAEIDKLKEAYKLVSDFYIIHGEREIELHRAMNDRENMIKQQIKVSAIRHMQEVFDAAYQKATGQKVTYEFNNR